MAPRAKRAKISKYRDIESLLKKLKWCKPNWAYLEMSPEAAALLDAPAPPSQLSHDLEEVIKRSNAFPIPFPISTMRLVELKKTRPVERLQSNIESTYPVVHERLLRLMAHFILYKREYGSDVEKQLYKEMTVPQLIDRILLKRAICFIGPRDKYNLITQESGAGSWESVGTDDEKPPLVLANCLSYDEIKLSALLCVSGHTECINDGTRHNRGEPSEDITQNAVIIGCVGPRFQRPGRMDCEEILVPRTGSVAWRLLWDTFFEVKDDPEVDKSSLAIGSRAGDERLYTERYVRITKEDLVFDNEAFYKRIALLAETVLLEANERARVDGRPAFVNVIGCGLGVWRVSRHQVDVYVLTFVERARALLAAGLLDHVAYVNFSYIQPSPDIAALFQTNIKKEKFDSESALFLEKSEHPEEGICVLVEKREPSSKLLGARARCLLVMMYAWDGNAHPGNEFWRGALGSSGDPAAACSTQVSELHNAHVNAHVRAAHARVPSENGVRTLYGTLPSVHAV
ncbi:uncharacterized protein LOC115447460 isoform X2 [Manduca sexta]|uniref:uncharacterized protein LOC115447460 isoform X2 n=1 Tax=Manduca sexta TaxID=7130 RepID=UPI00188F61C1|nr:uncharacterized protein LOC115447460 isoform X2 [Manduca sexta]XP_037299888.1 uncharacterized protein LOC115447460 isoform X2 [Manduca sexta]